MLTENQPLKAYNTFRVPARARYFAEIRSREELPSLFAQGVPQPVLVLGGGSNVLFTGDFRGTVLKISIKGISEQAEGEDVLVEAGAGVVWDELVAYCVDKGYAGIENLSLIPGQAGAAPIQNIGAYGVELKDVFDSLEAFDMSTGSFRRFSHAECKFAYRESVFKQELKGRFIICSVRLRLSTRFRPLTTYGSIADELSRRGIDKPSLRDIREVVSDIRVSKLPDPSTIGNAGSFFKNPVISRERFESLRKNFPDVVNFPMSDDTVKLAAGWLIEQCGWKGKVVGNTGTWKNQALVLVNRGNATGAEIEAFSTKVMDSVREKFGIILEQEVNIV